MQRASAKAVLNGHDNNSFVTPRDLNLYRKVLLDTIYPIGSIYISADATDPGILFGGEWVWLKGRFLLGAGGSYSNGQTGGEATHKLSIEEMPRHVHPFSIENDGNVNETNVIGFAGTAYKDNLGIPKGQDWSSNGYVATTYRGGDQPHNNMPPYLVVYMWRRDK